MDVDVSTDLQDEIGQLSRSIELLVQSTKDQAAAANNIANGDMTQTVTARSENDVLGKALAEMVREMKHLIASIKSASDQVMVGSHDISSSSQQLSNGASDQASAVEELSATIHEILTHAGKNADKAKGASEITNTAKDYALHGNTQMAYMLKAMEEINESSSKVSNVVKVIEDIAFQTNILSLNAAVEAANAGNAGKGFAVVAGEVKTLAQRSAAAAGETVEIIERLIQRSAAGMSIARETTESLNRIANEIEQAADLMISIAEASNEQTLSIEQINLGISQISEVVQTTAAAAEEAAAASEELSDQSIELNELLEHFTL